MWQENASVGALLCLVSLFVLPIFYPYPKGAYSKILQDSASSMFRPRKMRRIFNESRANHLQRTHELAVVY